MEQLNFSQYIIIFSAILCVFFLFLTLRTKRQNTLLSEQLIKTTITLEVTQKLLDGLQEKYEKINEFQNSLQVAELTTKFQKPRLDAQSIDTGRSTPGKYSNIQSLAQKGMSIEEIASTFAISTHEAQQLINLSKLAEGTSPKDVSG